MLARLFESLAVGVVVYIVAWVVIAILSALLPGIVINAGLWAGILGVLAFFVNLFSGRVWYNRTGL